MQLLIKKLKFRLYYNIMEVEYLLLNFSNGVNKRLCKSFENSYNKYKKVSKECYDWVEKEIENVKQEENKIGNSDACK